MVMAILLLAGCEPETYLFVNESPIAFEESGGSQIIDVIANKEWQATTNGGWCKVSPATGVGSENSIRITVQCEPNTGYDERSCILTVICADARKTVSITQSPIGTINDKIPDPNFRQYCIENFDTNNDGLLSYKEAKKVSSIQVNTGIISTLEGIEYFSSLRYLNCSLVYDGVSSDGHYYYDGKEVYSLLKQLNISNNTALTTLVCSYNQLTSLDVSNNSLLSYLVCSYNQLTSFVSNNTALTTLDCSNNQLTSLDVSNNSWLSYLDCSNNQLTSLDVSNNTALTTLGCFYNQLTSLDVSNNTALTGLSCYNNQLTSLDVSNNTALTYLSCRNVTMTDLYLPIGHSFDSQNWYSGTTVH